jgi:hypothetical protein
MNHRIPAGLAVLLLACVIASCATLRTYRADLSDKPRGVRIYPPKVYLLVDTDKERSHLIYLPDFERAYDVLPVAVLAEHQFAVEVDGGLLRSLTSKQDPTAFLTFVKEAATVGAGAAGVPVSKETFEGTFGLASGIYILTDDGKFEPIQGPAAP